ncbi:ABC transporter ATP-binding protein [Tessaracoccus sp. OH4464_COT-324]|uniref:ABC transporter ATP-binding protein n=1 Tax=Tessaracoccus sp. OH4464_COT-324 TaxID=2491059 RepID=UPI000F630606|nr:ATP-binding cassette domain-containing protein [Tessaracoccus sp. OH4464_COT-324]RRD47995.1 ATP-binding cassette domain-containing protein [Tessaracoccus sp. OH4464_COT-324]
MIEFKSVRKEYAGSVAVADFSLLVPCRKTVVLVGSSGSGKTTVMRMVNRMVEPTSGQVEINGIDVRSQNPVALRRSIGYVLQASGLLPHRTVLDNIATVPMLNGMAKRQARAAAFELMERVGLKAELGMRYPGQLSGGQQQRVGVARALAGGPEILLMDEPFGAVDPIVRRELQDELIRLQAELGKTILFVTHDIDEAFRLGDEVVVLREQGVVAQHGTPTEILARPANDFVRDFVGVDRIDRTLATVEVAGELLAVDGRGRPVGRLKT